MFSLSSTSSFLFSVFFLVCSRSVFSQERILVEFSQENPDVVSFSSKWSAEYAGPVKGLPSVHVFELAKETNQIQLARVQKDIEEGRILWMEFERPTFNRIPPIRDLEEPTDPSIMYQWHIYHTKVDEVWKLGYSGKGLRISVVDDGVNKESSDLGNLDISNSWNYLTDEHDPSPSEKKCLDADYFCEHGTFCSNLAVGQSNNFCGVGMAPSATLQGFLVLDKGGGQVKVKNKEVAEALTVPTDVSSNSYGLSPVWWENGKVTCGLVETSEIEKKAILEITDNGRSGKGTVVVFAAGNSGNFHEDTNMASPLNLRQVFAIGLSNTDYQPASWSCPGAGLMILAPGKSMFGSTIQVKKNGAKEVCKNLGSGTSFATPVVSGAVALLLEANENLSWRDVQHIFARSSYRQPSSHWIKNAAGRKFSLFSGFGNLDVESAVKLALNWTEFPKERSTFAQNSTKLKISEPRTEYQLMVDEDLMIESVVLKFEISVEKRGGLNISLTSPSGTEHVIYRARPDNHANYIKWPALARGFWDERSKGLWSVTIVKDSTYVNPGKTTINSIKLNIYGTLPNEYPSDAPDIFHSIEVPYLVLHHVSKTTADIYFYPVEAKVEKYQLEMKEGSNSEWQKVKTSTFDTIKVKNLKENTPYLFRGRFKVKEGWSDWGQVLSLITLQ